MADEYPARTTELKKVFTATFDFIASHGADKVFRRWNAERQEFKGSFLSTAFEVFALGIGYHMAQGTPVTDDLLKVVKDFWKAIR